MSGPITAILVANAPAVLLGAAAIRAAQAVAQAHELAHEQRQSHREAHAVRQEAQVHAAAAGRAALQAQAQQAQQEYQRLVALAQRLGLAAQVQGAAPAVALDVGDTALARYAQTLQRLNADMRQVLLAEAARLGQSLADEPDFSHALAQHQGQTPSRSQALLRGLDAADIAPAMLALARELDATPLGMRADLLANELRTQVQAHQAKQRKQALQEATAVVLEQSLKDLGYQVEDIAETLFVQGGVVHFRRADWGPYMVRLRTDATSNSLNFNVVRALAQGEQQEQTVLDHLAEDRWCAEFPALLKTLEARGIHLQVTRRLQAGELPVQCVAADKLPRFAQDEQQQSATQARARSQK